MRGAGKASGPGRATPVQAARRDVCAGLAVGAFAAGSSTLLGPAYAATQDDLWFVNAELRAVARQVRDGQAAAVIQKAMSRPTPELPAHEMRLVHATGGAPDVAVYVINAQKGAHRPAVLHMHGGGFVAGSAKHSVGALKELAVKLDCVVVTVEYRLAPGTTYAGAIEDDYAALRWLHGNAEELGVNRRRIAVMGESAGGTHAALLSFLARERGEYTICLQVLNYAALDDRTGVTVIPPRPIGTINFGGGRAGSGWQAFLGQAHATAAVPTKAVPARRNDLGGLPPAFIGVGSIDALVSENVDYARRLIGAGVPTQLIVVPGAFHGFDGFAADTQIARWYTASKFDALRRAFTES